MASRVKSRTADQNAFHSLAVAVVHALTRPDWCTRDELPTRLVEDACWSTDDESQD